MPDCMVFFDGLHLRLFQEAPSHARLEAPPVHHSELQFSTTLHSVNVDSIGVPASRQQKRG